MVGSKASPVNHYDLVTIGAGSGGVAASRYAASAYGARVAICEMGRVGGTCVIRGCIPKKLYMYAAQFSEGFIDAVGFGWDVGSPTFDLARMKIAKDLEVSRLEKVYESMLANANVTLLRGRARIEGPNRVIADGHTVTADRILIATGAAPHRPAIPGIEMALSSTEMLELTGLPRHLVVLGSGYVAVELASIFRGFGARVTLAFRSELPLRGFDRDLRTRLAEAMTTRGIDLVANFKPQSVTGKPGALTVLGDGGREIHGDVVLNAMGRHPNVVGLGLETVGIKPGAIGQITVDAHSRTSAAGVFAIGDVTNRLALTPVAIAEGRAFVDTEFGGKPRKIDHSNVSSAVFGLPPVASIGRSEEDVATQGIQYRVFESDFRPMKNTVSGRAERTYMKLIVEAATDQVLGIHMIGPDAPEIVQGLAVAVTMGAKKADFDATMAMHPTAAEEFMLLRTARL